MASKESKPETIRDYRKDLEDLVKSEAGRRDDVVTKQITDRGEAGAKLGFKPKVPDIIASEEILKSLSEQAGIPFVHLSDYPLGDLKVLRYIPASLARSYRVFPLREESDGALTVAVADPLNVTIVDNLRLLLDRQINPVAAPEEEINEHIDQYYGVGEESIEEVIEEMEKDIDAAELIEQFQEVDLEDLERIANEPPVIQLVNLILLQAIKDRASDLHIEPFASNLRVRYRVDGVLREITSPPKAMQIGILSRLKVLANMDISETRMPQDGRIRLNMEGREVDLRVATLPTVHGETMVMRILDKTMMLLGINQLGMDRDTLEKFLRHIHKPNGTILVTGPTGCGKTTSLYAAIQEVNDPGVKIITVEDPVEYELPGVLQINVNPGVGLTFARCLRHIVRHDPDIILIGEIRDEDTAHISTQAAITGHLVFSTMHTTSAATTVTRLLDMNVDPFMLSSTVEAVVGQRLVRVICANCKAPHTPSPEELADFGATLDDVKDIVFYKGEGCEECGFSGYRGRIGIFELMEVTEEIREMMLERAPSDDIHAMAIHQGMKTMRNDGWTKACIGVTTLEEVAKETPTESEEVISEEMERMIQDTIARVKRRGEEELSEETKEVIKVAEATQRSEPTPRRTSPFDSEAATYPHVMGDADKTGEEK